jgi:hypothetical protein
VAPIIELNSLVIMAEKSVLAPHGNGVRGDSYFIVRQNGAWYTKGWVARLGPYKWAAETLPNATRE